MGASYSVNLANLFLFYYENHFLSSYPNSIDFKYTFRYIDDLLTINNGNIGNTISSIYPSSLALELTNSSPYNSVDYLDLNISIGDDSFPVFKLFHSLFCNDIANSIFFIWFFIESRQHHVIVLIFF